MICKRCGAEVADELTFCTVCGEAMEQEKSPKKSSDGNRKKKLLYLIGGGIAAVLLIVLVVLIFSGDGAESRVEDLYDSVLEYDANALMEALPPEVLTYYKNLIDLEDSELEIVDSTELKESRVEELDNMYHEIYGTDFGYIEAVTEVEVELTFHGAEASRDPIKLYMVKVDGGWYLDLLLTMEELDEAELEDISIPYLIP